MKKSFIHRAHPHAVLTAVVGSLCVSHLALRANDDVRPALEFPEAAASAEIKAPPLWDEDSPEIQALRKGQSLIGPGPHFPKSAGAGAGAAVKAKPAVTQADLHPAPHIRALQRDIAELKDLVVSLTKKVEELSSEGELEALYGAGLGKKHPSVIAATKKLERLKGHKEARTDDRIETRIEKAETAHGSPSAEARKRALQWLDQEKQLSLELLEIDHLRRQAKTPEEIAAVEERELAVKRRQVELSFDKKASEVK